MSNQPERTPLGYLIVERLTQPQFLLALVSGALLWWLTHRLLGATDMPQQDKSLIAALVGFISGQMVGPGWQFYFGNTKASDEKTRALSDNAATLRQAGIPLGRPEAPSPVPVAVVSDYGTKSDLELIKILSDRGEEFPGGTRDEMIARLVELDSLPKEPHP